MRNQTKQAGEEQAATGKRASSESRDGGGRPDTEKDCDCMQATTLGREEGGLITSEHSPRTSVDAVLCFARASSDEPGAGRPLKEPARHARQASKTRSAEAKGSNAERHSRQVGVDGFLLPLAFAAHDWTRYNHDDELGPATGDTKKSVGCKVAMVKVRRDCRSSLLLRDVVHVVLPFCGCCLMVQG